VCTKAGTKTAEGKGIHARPGGSRQKEGRHAGSAGVGKAGRGQGRGRAWGVSQPVGRLQGRRQNVIQTVTK